MSTQLSFLPDETSVVPPGLEYLPDFLSPEEEAKLIACIDAGEWLADLARRVQHYGYKYDYSNRRLGESARIGPLPEWLTQLASGIREAGTEDAVGPLDAHCPFEQAIVNEYEPGQGIALHIDRDCFGPVVATVSLGSAVNMDFCCADTGDEYMHRLEPRSLERHAVGEVPRKAPQRCEGALIEVCAGEAPGVAGCPEGVGAGGCSVEVHAEPLC